MEIDDFEYEYKNMSVKELGELKEMIEQSLKYYKDLLEDPTKLEGASEDDISAIHKCKELMESDMDEVNKELGSRK